MIKIRFPHIRHTIRLFAAFSLTSVLIACQTIQPNALEQPEITPEPDSAQAPVVDYGTSSLPLLPSIPESLVFIDKITVDKS